jgi:hypothetical protein
MQIKDFTEEALIFQIGIAVDESLHKRWKQANSNLKKINKTASLSNQARQKIIELIESAEKLVENHKSKTLDFTGID